MTIRIGVNPSNSAYIGLESAITSANVVGTGAISLRAQASATMKRGASGTGTLALKAPGIAVIAIHPVIRRGPGTVSFRIGDTGTGSKIGHPFGTGSISFRVAASSSGKRISAGSGDLPIRNRIIGIGEIEGGNKLALGDLPLGAVQITGDGVVIQYIPGDGDLPNRIVISGDGYIQRTLTADGALSFRLHVKDVIQAVGVQHVFLDGVWHDPQDVDGLWHDPQELEGTG